MPCGCSKLPALEMLLPKLKLHIRPAHLPARLADVARGLVRPAKVHAHVGAQAAVQATAAGHVRPVQDPVAHRREQLGKVRAAKVCARVQLGERVLFRPDGVEHDVVGGVDVHLLGEVGVDAQKVFAAGGRCARVPGPSHALRLE